MSEGNSYISGILTGAVATIIGGAALLWMEGQWEPAPRLRWFTVAEIELPQTYFERMTLKPQPNDSTEVLESYYDRMSDWHNTGKVVVMVIDNSGAEAAKSVALLLTEKPWAIETVPLVGVSVTETSNDLTRVVLEGIQSESQVQVKLFGVGEYAIKHVLFDGTAVEELRYGGLYRDWGSSIVTRLILWGLFISTVFFGAIIVIHNAIANWLNKRQSRSSIEKDGPDRRIDRNLDDVSAGDANE